jgi:hypothetical protein
MLYLNVGFVMGPSLWFGTQILNCAANCPAESKALTVSPGWKVPVTSVISSNLGNTNDPGDTASAPLTTLESNRYLNLVFGFSLVATN